MAHQLVNVLIVAMIGVCLYEAYYRNLFQCAMLLGRCLFALLAAMALFRPAGQVAAEGLEFAPDYANAVAFIVIWIVVLAAFEPAAASIVRNDGRNMRFEHETPGRIVLAVLSGLLVSCAVGVNLVMLPFVEGLYFENDAQPIVRIQRKAAWLFSSLTFTREDVVTPAQMEAGGCWVASKLQEKMRARNEEGAEDLILRFEQRYTRPSEPEAVKQHRREIVDKLRNILGRPAAQQPAAVDQAPSQTARTGAAPSLRQQRT